MMRARFFLALICLFLLPSLLRKAKIRKGEEERMAVQGINFKIILASINTALTQPDLNTKVVHVYFLKKLVREATKQDGDLAPLLACISQAQMDENEVIRSIASTALKRLILEVREPQIDQILTYASNRAVLFLREEAPVLNSNPAASFWALGKMAQNVNYEQFVSLLQLMETLLHSKDGRLIEAGKAAFRVLQNVEESKKQNF